MAGRVEGKVAFITGAARGQGRAHAVRMAQEGADIIAVDICKQIDSVLIPLSSPEDLAETADMVKNAGGRIHTAEVDVRDYDALKAAVDAGVEVVLITPNKPLAELAAMDLRDAGATSIRVLTSGPDAWDEAGLSVVATPDLPSDAERLDFLFFVHDRHTGNAQASRDYLNWELGLIGQLKDWELNLFPTFAEHIHR